MPCFMVTATVCLSPSRRQMLGEWWRAVRQTPQIFRRIAFRKRTLEQELQEALLRGSLRKTFNAFSLWMLGLGMVIASGWAQLSGSAAQQYSGPAIILSYCFAGLTALLAACCFAELCSEFPVSGGAFSYVMVTFGSLPAFITLAGLLLEYALGMAAVARGFSQYVNSLLNLAPLSLVIVLEGDDPGQNAHTFDIMAAAIVMLMSILLSLGMRESAWFISGITLAKLVLLLMVAIVGYTQGAWSNMTPFTNTVYDVDGVFLASSVVFFTAVGFDAIANTAEEAQDVGALPWAILGTVGVSTGVYLLLALALALMVYPGIACPSCQFFRDGDQLVTFINAFVDGHGLKWMQYIVSLAALFGIVTSLTVGLFSASRIVMAASRDWLLPPFLAKISPRTQTPLVAQMVLGVIIALLSLFVEVDAATAMVSFGTLISLWIVCNAQMVRRYYPVVQLRFTRYGTVETTTFKEDSSVAGRGWVPGRHLSVKARKRLVWAHLLVINAISIALGAYYSETSWEGYSHEFPPPPAEGIPAQQALVDAGICSPLSYNFSLQAVPACLPCGDACDLAHPPFISFFVLAWFLATLSFQLCCPLEYQPQGWHVPHWLMPWLPCAGAMLVCFSLGALPKTEFWKVGLYFGVLLWVYILYSLPMSYIKHSRVDYVNTEELKVVELRFVNGQWRPARLDPAWEGGAWEPPSTATTMNPMLSGLPTQLMPSIPSGLRVESPGTSKSGGSGGNMRRPGSGEARAPGQPPLLHPQVQQVQRAAGLQLDGSRGRTVLPPTQEGDEQQEQHGSP